MAIIFAARRNNTCGQHCIFVKTISISSPATILNSPIEYLHSVTTFKGDLLKKELGIFNFKDLLEHYPFRHVDKTKLDKIATLTPGNEYAQVAGKITQIEILGEGRGKRLTARLQDETGEIELVWFQGINWIQKAIAVGHQYLVFGRLAFFIGKPQIAHPEIENFTTQKADGKYYLEPVYPSTEKLKSKGLNGRAIGKLTYGLLQLISEKDLPENLPQSIITQYKFISRFNACRQIHFPATEKHYLHAVCG